MSMFDEVAADYDELEKQDNPFVLALGIMRIIVKIYWRLLKWMINKFRRKRKWPKKKENIEQSSFNYSQIN